MTKSAKMWLSATVIITALLSLIFFCGPAPATFKVPKMDTSNPLTLQNFDEGSGDQSGGADPTKPPHQQIPQNNYQNFRTKALNQAIGYMGNRDKLNLFFNILSIVSIVASFSVTVIGANNGWHLSADKIDKDLPKVKNQVTKKWIILLSSAAVLSTTLANRCSAYADKEQSKGLEIIGLVKTADSMVAGALDINEVQHVAEDLELDLAKY
ncbi:hypothetical protein ACFGVR_15165 [Mucilaginibacter sp. AW1-3]